MPLYEISALTHNSETMDFILIAQTQAEAIGKVVKARQAAIEDPAYVGIVSINSITEHDQETILYHQNGPLDYISIGPSM